MIVQPINVLQPSFTVTRTIYPVGQGVFTSEIFVPKRIADWQNSLSEPFVSVCDCGTSNTNTLITNAITNFNYDWQIAAPECGVKPKLRYLFVTHFDEDHISGIYYLLTNCKITELTVCVPYISDDERIVLAAQLLKNLSYSAHALFAAAFTLNPVRAIRAILPHVDIDMVEMRPDERGERYDNNRILSTHIPVSTSRGTSGKANAPEDWLFVPVMLKEDLPSPKFTVAVNNFKNGYNAGQYANWQEELCDPSFWDSTQKAPSDLDKAKELQEEVGKELRAHFHLKDPSKFNVTSLCLYSGPASLHDPRYKSVALFGAICERVSPGRSPYWSHYHLDDYPACLYTGDFCFKQSKKAKGPSMVQLMLQRINSGSPNLNLNIGLIQMPHHGSPKNWDAGLMTIAGTPKPVFFACAQADVRLTNPWPLPGAANTQNVKRINAMHGHPNIPIVVDILNADACFTEVNGYALSRLHCVIN